MFYDIYISLCKRDGKKPSPVAVELGLRTSNVAQWKKGSTPRPEVLKKVANYFNVPISYLLGVTTDPNDRSKTHWAEVVGFDEDEEKEISPASKSEGGNDPDIRRIERARKNMSSADKQKMMKILEASFEDYFSDDYVDDDLNE